MIIAIDGPSGTGKSTLAKLLAKHFGFYYFNTGAMYRCFAFFVLKHRFILDSENSLHEATKIFDYEFLDENGAEKYLVENEDITLAIRQEKISETASIISKHKKVRDALLPIQRAFAKRFNVVFEGRDIGTVVFPKADVKFFLTASPEERAKRRFVELKDKFPQNVWEYENILKDIVSRDYQDQTRAVAPLKKAEDAYLIDTTNMSLDDVLYRMIKTIEPKIT